MRTNVNERTRVDLLDGLRGAAAVAVMVGHLTQRNSLRWLPGNWVAVDLFFILSGFVIAYSYTSKILGGMSGLEFLITRVIRLLPLYFAGLLVGLTAAAIAVADRPDLYVQVVKAFGLGTILLPYLNWRELPFQVVALGHPIFPLNEPAWSLFFESAINVLFLPA